MDSRALAIVFALVLLTVTRLGHGSLIETLPNTPAQVLFEFGSKPSPLPSPIPDQIQASPPTVAVLPPTPWPVAIENNPPTLQAQSAALFKMASKAPIFIKNGSDSVAIASVTKLMTAVIAKEIMLPDTSITLTPEDLLVEGHHQNLQAGDSLSLEEAFYLLLVSSDNSIAQALSQTQTTEPEFIAKMNQKANALGMTRTVFSNASGLNGNLSTPSDLFLLARYINQNHPPMWSISAQPNITIITRTGKTLELENTNTLIGKVPGLIGGKTGYTPQAAGSLLLVFEVGAERLVSVVLASSDRFGDTQKIISWYWQNYFSGNP